VILLAGIFRLGFLDNVLSRPFQRGFISAIGIVIFIDQLIPELGLSGEAARVGGVLHGSCVEKVVFLVENVGKSHGPTAAVSLGSFCIIMVCRYSVSFYGSLCYNSLARRHIKNYLQPRYPGVAYVPDRFIIVVLSALLCGSFHWDKHGIEVLGDIKSAGGGLFAVHWPFATTHLKLASDAFSTSFIVALLGFFESSVAAKSLGIGEKSAPVIQNIQLSANRELVALGTANVVGGLFMALPAFGGYGRSKVNASTGGKTPMSSIFLSIITLICILFLTPFFHYLPVGSRNVYQNAVRV
jgi:MFS superfamily sulfate permease-like transporter